MRGCFTQENHAANLRTTLDVIANIMLCRTNSRPVGNRGASIKWLEWRTPVLLVDLRPDDDCGKLTVTLGSYLRFGDDLAEAVDRLVDQWQHVAPPSVQLESVLLDRQDLMDE